MCRRAPFVWPDCFLIPRMSFGLANTAVRFVSYIRPAALLVPQKAVTELQGMYQVAVVGNDDKVSVRTVKVGERSGPMWIIDQGLKPGERVVVEGVQKVRDGMPVKITSAAASPAGN